MKFLKHYWYITFFLIIVITTYCGIRFYAYYSSPRERPIYKTERHYDDTIRIACIGDSWALGHKYHQCQISTILSDSLHQPVIVKSYGIGGLTSKEIYHALFEIDDLRRFMMKGYDYCIISAGINDTHKKMSTFYYTKSIECISNFLQANHIHPVILEIPDYNIYKAYTDQSIKDKIIQSISMIINHQKKDCKQRFRDALSLKINDNQISNVSIIRSMSWNKNYSTDLKQLYINDQVHLNEKGYQTLDSSIICKICRHYRTQINQKSLTKK
jgi:lysophospholipase L1-like esterase